MNTIAANVSKLYGRDNNYEGLYSRSYTLMNTIAANVSIVFIRL